MRIVRDMYEGEESCRTWKRRMSMKAGDFLFAESFVCVTPPSRQRNSVKPPNDKRLFFIARFSRFWKKLLEFPSVTQQYQALSNVAFDINISDTTNDVFEIDIYFSRCDFFPFRNVYVSVKESIYREVSIPKRDHSPRSSIKYCAALFRFIRRSYFC